MNNALHAEVLSGHLLPSALGLGSWAFSSVFLFVVCLLVSFLYAGIEAGLLSLNRARLRSRVHQGEHAAIRLNRLLTRPGRLLTTVLLVTNFADVAALVLITNALFRRDGGRGCVLAGLLMLPVYLLGLQLLPKSLFRRFPYRALAALAGLLEVTSTLLAPLLAVGGWAVRRGWLDTARTEESAGRPGSLFSAREEFKNLVAEGERTGALTAAEHGLIDNVIGFSALPARDVMRPPPEPFPWREGATVADLRANATGRRLDFLPVAGGETGGELVALIDVFTLLFERNGGRDAAVYLRRPPLVVAPGDAALRVLRRLRAARLPAAAVVDGDGQFVGIVRATDLVQKLV